MFLEVALAGFADRISMREYREEVVKWDGEDRDRERDRCHCGGGLVGRSRMIVRSLSRSQ